MVTKNCVCGRSKKRVLCSQGQLHTSLHRISRLIDQNYDAISNVRICGIAISTSARSGVVGVSFLLLSTFVSYYIGTNCPPCTRICLSPLKCGNHHCEVPCHQGACDQCPLTMELTCICGDVRYHLYFLPKVFTSQKSLSLRTTAKTRSCRIAVRGIAFSPFSSLAVRAMVSIEQNK